jgi:hypothetical protein
VACIEFLQIQMICRIHSRGRQEHFLDMIFNSAREEESDGELILSQRASDDLDEIRNHLFIIAFVESIYDNDRR